MLAAAGLGERPLTPADVPAVTALRNRFEVHFFGVAETGDVEAREELDLVDSWDAGTLSLWDRAGPGDAPVAGSSGGPGATGATAGGDRLVAVAYVLGQAEGVALADPASPAVARTAYARLLRWLADVGSVSVELLSRDEPGLQQAAAQGWVTHHRSYELFRDAGSLPEPRWPEGVRTTDLDLDRDAAALHHLIYERARWPEVPGHHLRPPEEWRRMLVGPSFRHDLQVVAWADGTPVGVSFSSLQAGAVGYVDQLAVDRAHRRRGLGRALLLESFRRLTAAGATRLGLEVQGANPGALALYEGVGLGVDREWVSLARGHPTRPDRAG